MSRKFTKEEIREKFLETVWQIINYWVKEKLKDVPEEMRNMMKPIIQSAVEGSIFSTFDYWMVY